MPQSLQAREKLLAGAVGLLLLAALAGPPLAQAADYHAFADQSLHGGLHHAGDVLSNIAFAFVAFAMVAVWAGARDLLSRGESLLVGLGAGGLLLTAFASTWYHLAPDDAGLAIDRAAMAVAFAGLLGLAACRVSERAGLSLGLFALAAGPLAVQAWSASGNLLPWVLVQGGGLLLLLALAAVRAPDALPVRWAAVIAIYAVAKALEAGDHAIWEATGQWVSGHTLKHLVAAAAAWPVVATLRGLATERHNRLQLPVRAA